MSGLLEAFSLNFSFGSKVALSDVTFSIERGEIVGLLGPNGSGKSTLLKVLSGILSLDSPSGGVIRYLGTDIRSFSAARQARSMAYVPSEVRAEFPLTAREMVSLGRICHAPGLLRQIGFQEQKKIDEAMKRCRCWGLRDRLYHTLSGGEKQLVNLGRALTQEARVLLLDEAMGKMDLHHQSIAGKLLKELSRDGYGVILVSHDWNFASDWVSRCVVMQAGKKVIDATPREAFQEEALLKIYPGAELSLGKNPSNDAPKVFFRT